MFKGTSISRNLLAAVLLLGLASPGFAQSSKGDVNRLLNSGDSSSSGGSSSGGGGSARTITEPEHRSIGPDSGTIADIMASGGARAEMTGYIPKVTIETLTQLLKDQGMPSKVFGADGDFPVIRIGSKNSGAYIGLRRWKGNYVYLQFQYLIALSDESYKRITYADVNDFNRRFYMYKASKYETKKYKTLRLDIDLWIGNGMHADAFVSTLNSFMRGQKTFVKDFKISVD